MAQGKIGELTIVAGYASKDAELKHVGANDTPLCEFSLIVGKKPDGKGAFANCKAWRGLGEYASGIQKGDTVCVVGRTESREYNGKTYTDLIADWLNITGKGGTTAPVISPSGKPFPKGTTFSEIEDAEGELPF